MRDKRFLKTTCKCGQPRRPNQRNCYDCHARSTRNRVLSPEALKRCNARHYVKTYVRRGKVRKLPCLICGNPDVESHHEDYTKPLEVVWLCKGHHGAVGKGLKLQVPAEYYEDLLVDLVRRN